MNRVENDCPHFHIVQRPTQKFLGKSYLIQITEPIEEIIDENFIHTIYNYNCSNCGRTVQNVKVGFNGGIKKFIESEQ